MGISVIGGADGPTSVFLAGKFGNIFFIPACFVLVIFYGIYFAKQLQQKRQGIRTNQLGSGKDKSVRIREMTLLAATVLIIPVELVSMVWNWNFMPSAIRGVGAVVGFLGDGIFFTAVWTMKDSWRAGIPDTDRTEFVSCGIYQYSRNPAFLGFDMIYVGVLLMYFNWVLLLFTVWAAIMFHLQILQEEKYLATVFGDQYLEYKKRTCRYWGRRDRV